MQRREYVFEESVVALSGGESAAISISTTSAQSAAILTGRVVVFTTVDCWFRQGADPTALSTGVDQFLPSGTQVRIVGIEPGNKLAFKAGSAGTVYITPGA